MTKPATVPLLASKNPVESFGITRDRAAAHTTSLSLGSNSIKDMSASEDDNEWVSTSGSSLSATR
eukprot:CAMPEP_0201678278 /NCGR_PEP_ID=MMETSP0494-20130426/45943_1 /ASSEMBLY_ACC=CAM_ASM_000839 /TAXON_ID=420259 /ORGANISM="Thalassiosira gravida, Strain GMp14c1" /LENGTH=64 /DNA_ID=CAMNT_0048161423 /DNA_START=210 /DNA_END=405 /DNA_ORIENTATION=+